MKNELSEAIEVLYKMDTGHTTALLKDGDHHYTVDLEDSSYKDWCEIYDAGSTVVFKMKNNHGTGFIWSVEKNTCPHTFRLQDSEKLDLV